MHQIFEIKKMIVYKSYIQYQKEKWSQKAYWLTKWYSICTNNYITTQQQNLKNWITFFLLIEVYSLYSNSIIML